jgi:hypothetical protein
MKFWTWQYQSMAKKKIRLVVSSGVEWEENGWDEARRELKKLQQCAPSVSPPCIHTSCYLSGGRGYTDTTIETHPAEYARSDIQLYVNDTSIKWGKLKRNKIENCIM